MAVLLPQLNADGTPATYTVRVRNPTFDTHGMPILGNPLVLWSGPGRVRETTSAEDDIALDPSAWPAAQISPDDSIVDVVGPDIDGVTRTWILTASNLRAGNLAALTPLDYVQASGSRSDE